MRTTSKLTIGVLILTAGSWLATTQSEAQDSSRSAAPDAQFTSEGSERCLTCHAGESMTAVLDTPHGDATNPHTPFANYGCESCHGPGSWHISRARGGAGFPPLLGFHIEEATSDPDNIDTEAIAIMTQACTNCHENDMGETPGLEWAGSVHAEGPVTCVSCHTGMHSANQPMTQREEQVAVCSGCHEQAIADHPRFERSGIMFDNLTCYECHDVHQLIGAE